MNAITNILTLNKLEVKGPRKLKGTHVIATDLRGGASLFLAGLIASGTTEIDQCEVILRGYSIIIDPHIIQVFGINNYIEIGGIIKSSAGICEIVSVLYSMI